MAPHPEVWPPAEATAALFWECLAHVLSRNFHREELVGREGPYLLPGLDILNHHFECNTKFEVRGGGRKHEAAFTVVTTRPLQRGEQVYVTYGRIGAARFAVEFQFVNERIQEMDAIRFSAPVLVDLATCLRAAQDTAEDSHACRQEMARRVDYLQRLGIVYDEGLYLSRPSDLQLAPPPVADEDDDDDGAKHSEEVRAVLEQARIFTAVCYLLVGVRTKDDFTTLYKTIGKFWAAPREVVAAGEAGGAPRRVATRDLATAAIRLKAAAVQAQKDGAAATFADVKADGVRRQLLQRALQSELDTLAFFEKWIHAR
ncbi:hypothetical protein STCU_04713 [Strigomonas culicis]|uniref:Uncharacterized protein n=1 Tax=Strigomonas culicis TaxID=28005 RepID=S9UK37_9TRYP|nr:hypothetical protein STCU_04713 [Strigomonas culicis]|eukprot:EPY29124.1 hypothetical protein STCU_04713 [Strigomonas culicis]